MTDPFDRIAGYYTELIERFGHDPRACDYGRPESQAIKFRVLAEVADLSGHSVLDVGCGFADFADYLNERYQGLRYAGIDITPRMIEEARRLHAGVDLRVGNILQEESASTHDVVVANGIFYLLGDDAARLMREMVRRMFDRATLAVAFNSLSSWTPSRDPGEFYADPLETLVWCRTITPWVVLRHDYHPRDFTVYMYRHPRQ